MTSTSTARRIAVRAERDPAPGPESHAPPARPAKSSVYDPERYAQLTPVVEPCLPQPYRKSVAANVLERLAMKDSVPGRDLSTRRS